MKYRKKPVVIEAVQWNGVNRQEITSFVSDEAILEPIELLKPFRIGTLEGEHIASVMDFIIKGVKGEFYPCKPDIFYATYEVVE